MSTETLTPAQEAFVALSDHCMACPGCKVDLDQPKKTDDCPTAQNLYKAWLTLWREEKSR
jgi:hypothetical protein